MIGRPAVRGVVLFLCVLGGALCFMHGSAKAATPDGIPSTLPIGSYLLDLSNQPSLPNGTQGSVPGAFYKVYVGQAPAGPTTITMTVVNNTSCNSINVKYYYVPIDQYEFPTGAPAQSIGSSLCSNPTITIQVPSSAFVASQQTGHSAPNSTQLYVADLFIQLPQYCTNPNGSCTPIVPSAAVWFTLNGGANTGLGYVPAVTTAYGGATIIPNGTPFQQGTPPNELQWSFAPECDWPSGPGESGNSPWSLWWFEDDYGTANQPQGSGFTVQISAEDRTTGLPIAGSPWIIAQDTNLSNPNYAKDTRLFNANQPGGITVITPNSTVLPNGQTFNWSANDKYTLQFLNVYNDNGIEAGLPFDSGNFSTGCPNQKPPVPAPWLGIDQAACASGTVSGWAGEPNGAGQFLTNPLSIAIYADGPPGNPNSTLISPPNAMTSGDPSNPPYSNTYSVTIPSPFRAGSHVFYVYATYSYAGGSITTGYQVNGPIQGGNSDGSINLNNNCPQFSFSPNPTVTGGTDENPTNITFSDDTGYSYDAQPRAPGCVQPVTIAYTVTENYKGAITTSGSTSSPHCVGEETDIYPPTPFTPPPGTLQAGDYFCLTITISPGGGYVDANNNFVAAYPGDNSVTRTGCLDVHNDPTFKALGAGVVAGDCNNNGGELASWNNDSGTNPYGSGSQLSALALLNITGFASAQNTANTSPTDLSFANNGTGVNVAADAYSPGQGGNFGDAPCLPTFTPPASGDTTIVTQATAGADYTIPNPPTSDLVVGDNKSIFVSGGTNVYIARDIRLQPGWNASNVPSFVLQVTGGNIYIAAGVQELDGLYIAEPDAAGNGGQIYDCASGPSQPVAASSMYGPAPGGCSTRLLVYGSFAAKQINLMRTYGSLRNESTGSCSNAGGSAPLPSGLTTCAAEVFQFSPEMYLSNPAVVPSGGGGTKFDSITSLPPVL